MPQTDSNGFQIVGSPQAIQPPTPTTDTEKDPLGFPILGSGGSSPSGLTTPLETPETPFQAASQTDSLGFRVVNQPTEPPSTNQPPPDEGFLKKSWRVINTPLSESLFGLPESRQGAGGLERAGEKILSGFTSPLSLLLTIGTLGTGGFIESAGANLLKDTLMAGADGLDAAAAADKVAQFEKAAQAATTAYKTTGQSVKDAVESTGMDYNEFRSLGNTLYDKGLKESDLLGGNIIQRGLSASLRSLPGMDAVTAQKLAKYTQLGMDAGFTGQQLHTAVQTVPQVFDALKDGRYDDALEYATEGAVSGTLGLIGASHALNQAGETFGSLNEREALRPSEENQKLNKTFGDWEDVRQSANQHATNLLQELRDKAGANTGTTFSPSIFDNAKAGIKYIFQSKAAKQEFQDKMDRILVGLETGNDPELARQVGNALADVTGQDKVGEGAIPAPVHPNFPERIKDWVDSAKDKFTADQKKYLSRWVDAYHGVANGLSKEEGDLVDRLRSEDDKNWNMGNAMGLITSHIDNHIHHVWGQDADDVGNELIQAGRTGKLETSVTQARQRVWDTFAEGLLKGRKIVGDDPMSVIAWDRANILKAAANRGLIDNLRDKFVRGSDGRPLVVMSGEAHALQNPDGGNPALMVNMNRVRDIRIANSAVDAMQQSGELDRFLKRGDILDITKKFTPNNIDQAINQLENMAIKIDPKFDPDGNVIIRKDIQTLKDVKSGAAPATALDDLNTRYNKPQYVWHPQDYVTPANKSLQGWNWLAKTDDGTNVLARSDIKFHPEAAQYMINRLGLEKSYLRENKGIGRITGPILKGGTKAKAVLLSFSPFHLMQEALRGVMMGVNPIRLDPIGEIGQRPAIAAAVHEGMTIAPDKNALEEHSIGVAQHAPFISKIPILGKAMDWYQDFLFNRYIPSLKAQAAEVMTNKYKAAHPDWTERAVGKAVADHVNNAFGGQNWRAMGRAAATQDWFHIFALAPDWLESEMRFAASTLRGGLGDKNFSREQVLKMSAGLWGIARVMNYLNTGNMHLEAPFGVATKDKDGREIVYSIRTLPVDILHMASDPAGFLKGRLSPFARLSDEALSGRDTFGRKLAPGDLAIDIARNMAPIPFQTLGQIESGQSPEVGNMGQLAKAGGLTANVYRTEAEKLAIQLASEHNEEGALDPAKLQHLETISHIEDGLRSGTMNMQQLHDARDFGTLTPDDYKKIRDNIKITHGLDPDTARMVSKVSRLPMADVLQIWDRSTPAEKHALHQVLIKKRNEYIQKALKSETPQQRLDDPIFRRVRLMVPEENEAP